MKICTQVNKHTYNTIQRQLRGKLKVYMRSGSCWIISNSSISIFPNQSIFKYFIRFSYILWISFVCCNFFSLFISWIFQIFKHLISINNYFFLYHAHTILFIHVAKFNFNFYNKCFHLKLMRWFTFGSWMQMFAIILYDKKIQFFYCLFRMWGDHICLFLWITCTFGKNGKNVEFCK